ncbi:MAG TPA: hypothetical protein VHZ33_24450 [Trebonia sp.]|jgi:hypothetical protein|nr:hypothetical protein [Trebonia sp.]
MIVLIFLVGSLFGLLLGALLCIRFVRQGVTGDLSPKLRQILGQLDTIEAELTYVVSSRYAELNAQLLQDSRRQNP